MHFKFVVSVKNVPCLKARDIYGAIDRSQLTLFALFDVGAAFDTVDHGILLERLRISLGVTGAFLCWLESFLGERTLCVVHGPTRSPWVPAPYGLPQGSVLGPSSTSFTLLTLLLFLLPTLR